MHLIINNAFNDKFHTFGLDFSFIFPFFFGFFFSFFLKQINYIILNFMKYLWNYILCAWFNYYLVNDLPLTAFYSGLNFTVMSHDLHYHAKQAGVWHSGSSWPMSLFNAGCPLCMLMASLIFLLCQFSSRSTMFTSLIAHWWPVFNLCSLTADRGWRHNRCSFICVPSGLAGSPM